MSAPAKPVFVPSGVCNTPTSSGMPVPSDPAIASTSLPSGRFIPPVAVPPPAAGVVPYAANKSERMAHLRRGETVAYHAPVSPMELLRRETADDALLNDVRQPAMEPPNVPQAMPVPVPPPPPPSPNAKFTILAAPSPPKNEHKRVAAPQAEQLVSSTHNNKCQKVDNCPICFESLDRNNTDRPVVRLKCCSHMFHEGCLTETWRQGNAASCPVCRQQVATLSFGKSPPGTMTISKIQRKCPGFRCRQTFEVQYAIPSGVQTYPYHPNPGERFSGTTRVAYLPCTTEGEALLARLTHAFQHGLVFAVGTSLTTGRKNTVTWTSIPHKTSLDGGVHGFPDGNYLENCNNSLTALHVPLHCPIVAVAKDRKNKKNVVIHYDAPALGNDVWKEHMVYLEPLPDPSHCIKCQEAISTSSGCILPVCRHAFHYGCLCNNNCGHENMPWSCPHCQVSLLSPQRHCPSGTLTLQIDPDRSCPGFGEAPLMKCLYEVGTTKDSLQTSFQAPYHPNPGKKLATTNRTTFLPFTEAGCDLYVRLRYAWSRGYTFRVGFSVTHQTDNVIVWNPDIPHKTNLRHGHSSGGNPLYSFPDDKYLDHCHEMLDGLKEIPTVEECWQIWERENRNSS